MSKPVKVCMYCRYAVEVETPKGAIPLLNEKPRQCVFSPPTPIMVGLGNGGYAVMPVYPHVGADTVSCSQFDNEAGATMSALDRRP